MPQWQKPENALRRANELLEVGKKQDALDTLHDVIKARKYRQWTKVHEQIMTKHLELCVELRKPHLAKDGLFQYRNMCQQVNSKSLEDVIATFLVLAEKKAEQAREESHGLVEDVEDLDQAESPEKILLSAVSGEGAQDRADRAVLSPWLRFLWESYRQCLELLRNNMQVEILYHRVAKQAFHFCLKYQRKAEFRKLCDNLRTHLNQIQKTQHTHAHYALKLTNLETLAMHQETRLIQLDIAIQMELWQEAFKSVEDVHQLMQLSKRQAKPSTLASYYEKLALIFWKADNTLYHAATLMKLFQLTRELKKSVSADELAHLATRVLLSTLSVSFSAVCSDLGRHLEMEETQLENRRRLATLIMLPSPPTRQGLLKDVVRLNVHTLALPMAQKFYKLLELEFCPLSLAQELQKQLDVLEELAKKEYIKYMDTLKEVAAYKILKQVSQVYQTATFKFLCKIIPYYDRTAVERLVVSAGKKSQMQVRLHHRTESVEFGGQEGLSLGGQDEESQSAFASVQLNVPLVQTMPNEQIKQHLQQMYSALQEAAQAVDLDSAKQLMENLRNQIIIYGYHKQDHHKSILERKKQIEAYKEMAEKIRSVEEEKQKEQDRRANEQKQREIEQRLQLEKANLQEQQKRRHQEELQRRMMQERLDRMKDLKLRKIIEDLPEEEFQNLDHEMILQKQISHLEQEKRDQLARLKQQERKWDYFIRAMHIEEIPLREEEYKEWAVKDREMWETYETERIKKTVEDHKNMVEAYNRLKRMEDDADEIIEKIRLNRAGDFQKRVADWEKRLKETREKRLQERKEERKAKRREEYLQNLKANPPQPAEPSTTNRQRIPMQGGGGGSEREDRYGPRPPRPDEPSNWRTKDGMQQPQLPERERGDRDRGFDRDRGGGGMDRGGRDRGGMDRDRGMDRAAGVDREPPAETPENWRAAPRTAAEPNWSARVGPQAAAGGPPPDRGGYRRGQTDYEDRRGYDESRRGPPTAAGYEDRRGPPSYEGRRSGPSSMYDDRRQPPERNRVPPDADYCPSADDRQMDGPAAYEDNKRSGYDDRRAAQPTTYDGAPPPPRDGGYDGPRRAGYEDSNRDDRDQQRYDRPYRTPRSGPPSSGDYPPQQGSRRREGPVPQQQQTPYTDKEGPPPSQEPDWRRTNEPPAAEPDWNQRTYQPPPSRGPPPGEDRMGYKDRRPPPPSGGYEREDRYNGGGSYRGGAGGGYDRRERDQQGPPPYRQDQAAADSQQGPWRRAGPPPPSSMDRERDGPQQAPPLPKAEPEGPWRRGGAQATPASSDRDRDSDMPPPPQQQPKQEVAWRRQGPPPSAGPPPADRDRDDRPPPQRAEPAGAWRRGGPPPQQQQMDRDREPPPSARYESTDGGQGQSSWRRGPPQDRDRSDREPPPSDGQGAWRRAGGGGPPPDRDQPRQDAGGAWRRSDGPPPIPQQDRDRKFARN